MHRSSWEEVKPCRALADTLFLCFQLYDSLEKAAQEEARSKPGKEAAWALTVLEELRQRFSRLVGSWFSSRAAVNTFYCNYILSKISSRVVRALHFCCHVFCRLPPLVRVMAEWVAAWGCLREDWLIAPA